MKEDEARAKEWVIEVFSRAAPMYDRVGPRTFSYWGKRLVEVAVIRRGAHVLDVATGKGAVLFPAAQAVGSAGRVVGVDLAEPMVQEAASEIRRQGIENADVLLMDAEDLKFPDATFDYVLSSFGLLFFPRPDRALTECARVLKPRGAVAVIAAGQFVTLDVSGQPSKRFRELLDEYSRLSAELTAYKEREQKWPSPVKVWTQEGLEQALMSSGFVEVQVWEEKAEFVFADIEEWWSAQWSHWRRAIFESMETDVLERFQKDVFRILDQFTRPDGIHMAQNALFGKGNKKA